MKFETQGLSLNEQDMIRLLEKRLLAARSSRNLLIQAINDAQGKLEKMRAQLDVESLVQITINYDVDIAAAEFGRDVQALRETLDATQRLTGFAGTDEVVQQLLLLDQ